jgi:hypothetical protein
LREGDFVRQAVIPMRTKKVATWLLIALIAIAAIINVPWALTRMRSRIDVVKVPASVLENPTSRLQWPSSTAHAEPWPAPQYWMEARLFGWRYVQVQTARQSNDEDPFSMQVQQMGWPLPVIEQKQMWWNWNDAGLTGPQPDPAPSLMLAGLVLNPLVLGFGAWCVLVLPWLLMKSTRRGLRRRRNCCLECGYPIGTSPMCTECGAAVIFRKAELS